MSYKLIRDFTYPFGRDYGGPAVETDFEFRTPVVNARRIADDIISELQRECQENNLDTLRTRVWCDTTPWFETHFFVTFSLYSEEAHELGSAQPLVPAWLIALIPTIIRAVLLIVLVVLILLVVREIRDIMYSPAGPALAEAFKWSAVAVAVVAGAVVVRAIAGPKKKGA